MDLFIKISLQYTKLYICKGCNRIPFLQYVIRLFVRDVNKTNTLGFGALKGKVGNNDSYLNK